MRDCLGGYHDPYYPPRYRYGFGSLVLDFVLVLATGGIWLLWILIRFLRTNTRY